MKWSEHKAGMNNLRKYGHPPFTVAVLHGGPGGPGYMAPVARELSCDLGVLEPLQTADSLEGQIEELRAVLAEKADLPITLVGSSWGAMLGFIVSARFPELVCKLIMIGSAPFEEQYAKGIQETRFSRFTEAERQEVQSLMKALDESASQDTATPFARLGILFTKADAYDPLTLDIEVLDYQIHIYQRVWREALDLRLDGRLLELGRQIRCPVLAIHGDYDPHPAEGVDKPLRGVVKDFRFILLANCGHLPWIERQAKDRFYATLRDELRPSGPVRSGADK